MSRRCPGRRRDGEQRRAREHEGGATEDAEAAPPPGPVELVEEHGPPHDAQQAVRVPQGKRDAEADVADSEDGERVGDGPETAGEHRRWQEAAAREGARYGIDPAYVRAALAGESAGAASGRRIWLDWILVGGATATFVGFGIVARVPQLALGWGWVAGLTAAMLALLSGTGWLLWRTTRFN